MFPEWGRHPEIKKPLDRASDPAIVKRHMEDRVRVL